MKKIIVGNWKMNSTGEEAINLTAEIANSCKLLENKAEVVLCPPFIYIDKVRDGLKNSNIKCGGQDCHFASKGAYTGNISPEMLKDAGCEYVILGHSERRQYEGETDELINKKATAAINAGLKVVLCVGESLEQREAGNAVKVINNQLDKAIPPNATAKNLIIGYEPVWAIGTGKIPTLAEIAEIHAEISKRGFASIYGGSVKPSNAKEILAISNVSGALVGGASLNANDFLEIIKQV